jgi:nicotinamidase-related amidase
MTSDPGFIKIISEAYMKEKKIALVIIDMQNDFVLPGAPMRVAGACETIPRIKKLLDFFRKKNLPVFHVVREYRADASDVEFTRIERFRDTGGYVVPGTKGCEILEELSPIAGEHRIVKNRYSAFMNTELDFILRRLGITDLVICGTQYPVCVRTTIFDAVAYEYRVINITDATSAQTTQIAEANIFDIRNIGARCVTLDEFLKEF